MTKILVLTSTWPYRKHHNHPRFINTLCRRLKKYHSLHVLAPSIKGEKLLEKKGVEVSLFRYCPAPFEILTGGDGISTNLKHRPGLYFVIPFYLISLILHCRKMVCKKKITVIHAHWIIPQGLAAVLCRIVFALNTSIVITSHGGDLYGFSGKIMIRLKKWVLNHADHIAVVSRAMKQHCIDHLDIPADKITVCPMGVDLEQLFVPGKIGRDPHSIVFVGRLVEKKGVDVLIRAMEKVTTLLPMVRLDLIGGGNNLGKYKSLSRCLGLSDAIRFLGVLPNHALPDYFQRVGLAVMPFRVERGGDQEGLGLTMIEAIGCGCTVIASDLPAVRDVIKDGKAGYLVPPDKPEALADKIVQLIKAQERGETLCPQARQWVLEKFDWEGVAKRYASLLSCFDTGTVTSATLESIERSEGRTLGAG